MSDVPASGSVIVRPSNDPLVVLAYAALARDALSASLKMMIAFTMNSAESSEISLSSSPPLISTRSRSALDRQYTPRNVDMCYRWPNSHNDGLAGPVRVFSTTRVNSDRAVVRCSMNRYEPEQGGRTVLHVEDSLRIEYAYSEPGLLTDERIFNDGEPTYSKKLFYDSHRRLDYITLLSTVSAEGSRLFESWVYSQNVTVRTERLIAPHELHVNMGHCYVAAPRSIDKVTIFNSSTCRATLELSYNGRVGHRRDDVLLGSGWSPAQ